MDSKSKNNDPFGKAILAYANTKNKDLQIEVLQEDFEPDLIPIHYLFRTKKDMPKLELDALKLCKEKVLDVGAAAACHSKILKDNGKKITLIDVSEGAIEYIKKEKFENAYCQSIFEFQSKDKFDTILLLMNGIGIAGSIDGLKILLEQLKTLLAPGGEILLDSSDIKYLFEEEDGSLLIPISKYYGETKYQVKFKHEISDWFPWLFIDFDTLKMYSEKAGYKVALVSKGEHFEYLAKLSL